MGRTTDERRSYCTEENGGEIVEALGKKERVCEVKEEEK
jgi:hypothetical protein